jgi:hypothetical protein
MGQGIDSFVNVESCLGWGRGEEGSDNQKGGVRVEIGLYGVCLSLDCLSRLPV